VKKTAIAEKKLEDLIKLAGSDAKIKHKKVMESHFCTLRQTVRNAASSVPKKAKAK
jgi:hypothetical protein